MSENTIILSWTEPEGALDYIIVRNGIEIGGTVEDSFIDFVDFEGTYTYCVIAEYLDGDAAPQCIIVEAEWGIGENEANFSIYPNPVNSTLYVNGGDAEYTYAMFNGMGQMVVSGNGRGTEEISVDGLLKGVYFLRLTSGTQVRVEKIVVE